MLNSDSPPARTGVWWWWAGYRRSQQESRLCVSSCHWHHKPIRSSAHALHYDHPEWSDPLWRNWGRWSRLPLWGQTKKVSWMILADVRTAAICSSCYWTLPGLGQSNSPTTNFDLFLKPSRNVTTKSRMSSALLEVNVYSSPLIVAKVKLCPWSFPPLTNKMLHEQEKKIHLETVWVFTYRLLDTAVISGKESSRRTCSCSSTK